MSEDRTRKPTATGRPTRTPDVNEERTRKPTATGRPTRTPDVKEEQTRKPTSTARPTRTPGNDEERTRKPISTERPTRTPDVKEEQTRKPTSTARPTRTPAPEAPPPVFSANGISATCSAEDKGGPAPEGSLIAVTLRVTNDSGAEITGLTAHALDIQGGAYTLGGTRGTTRNLNDGNGASFGSQVFSNSTLTISASASASGPSGELIQIGPVSCN
ncbi:MAG: hypothetical protein ABI629_14690 [bacterium]